MCRPAQTGPGVLLDLLDVVLDLWRMDVAKLGPVGQNDCIRDCDGGAKQISLKKIKASHAYEPPVRDALSSSRIIRNHFLKIVACILWGWSSPLLYAATDEIAGSQTNLAGTTEGIISHRFQKHSWITPDGRFHVMINTGSTEDALQLSSEVVNGKRHTAKIPGCSSSESPYQVTSGRLTSVLPLPATPWDEYGSPLLVSKETSKPFVSMSLKVPIRLGV